MEKIRELFCEITADLVFAYNLGRDVRRILKEEKSRGKLCFSLA